MERQGISDEILNRYDPLFKDWHLHMWFMYKHPNEEYTETQLFIDRLVEERRKEWKNVKV
jgi:hypothetical protein